MMSRSLVLPLAIAAVLLCSCNGGETQAPAPPPAGPYRPNTSVENVIANLKTAMTRAEIEPYASLLDEQLAFVFDSSDVARLGSPPSWNREQFVAAWGCILGDSVNVLGYEICCDSLSVYFLPGPPDTVSSPGFTKVSVQMTIEISMWSHAMHQRMDTGVGEVNEHLYLRKTGTTWKVVRWEEESFATKSPLCICGTIGEIMWLWKPT